MKEFEPIQRLKELVRYKRNVKPSREPELCYPGEIGGGHNNLFTRDLYPEGKEQEIVLFPIDKSK